MDDRQEFAAQRTAFERALASDEALRRSSLETFARSDAHGFSYVWDWLGLPVIQAPTDIVALQEIVWRTRPQLIIETGVARGGSVIFLASMLQLVGDGLVLGIDIDIRPHNRAAIESHPLAHRVALVEGSSTAPEVADQVRRAAAGLERVMVVLDSDHSERHVLGELELYAPLVTVGSYLVVADTVVEHVPTTHPPDRPWGPGDNPATATATFLAGTDAFEVDQAIESKLIVSSNPGGYLRRVRAG